MRKLLTTDWHASRIFRVGTGLVALIYGIIKQDSLMGIAGVMLLLMGISNIGCGARGGCGIPSTRNSFKKDFDYQELN
jgi:hypothetical protein